MDAIIRDIRQLGQAIRRQREGLGWTQGQLAARSSLRQATISELEQGIPRVRFDTVTAILVALDLELVARPRTRDENDLEVTS